MDKVYNPIDFPSVAKAARRNEGSRKKKKKKKKKEEEGGTITKNLPKTEIGSFPDRQTDKQEWDAKSWQE